MRSLPNVYVIMNSKHWNLTDAVEINATMLIINTMLVCLVKNTPESVKEIHSKFSNGILVNFGPVQDLRN